MARVPTMAAPIWIWVERFPDDRPDDELTVHGHSRLPRHGSGHGGLEPNAPWILFCSDL
jgi:hypothetical protein